jgi:hypothetical protein
MLKEGTGWVLGSGYWVLGSGYWVLGSALALGSGVSETEKIREKKDSLNRNPLSSPRGAVGSCQKTKRNNDCGGS